MHKIGDKSEDEYRARIQEDVDLLGGFLEDDELAAEVGSLTTEDGDDWYEEYLKRNWAGHPEYVGNGKEAEH
jgi:hypothetical protein